MSKRFRALLMCWLLVLMMCVQVFAASGAGTYDNSYTDEQGNTYVYQDDQLYQVINGQLYQVELGSGAAQSIIDVIKSRPNSEVPDTEIMGRVNEGVSGTVGLAISVIIYIFFAMTAFTTACDLLYIGVPGIRPTLWEQPAMAGPGGMHMHPGGPHGHPMHPTGRVPEEGRSGGRCLISSELQQIMRQSQQMNMRPGGPMMQGQQYRQTGAMNQNIILTYLKRRAVSIVIIVVVFMLLVTSSVFTDFGLNIGNMLYQNAAKFMGF